MKFWKFCARGGSRLGNRDLGLGVRYEFLLGKKAKLLISLFPKTQSLIPNLHFTTPRFDVSINSIKRSTSLQSFISSFIFSTACVVFNFAERSR